MKAFISALILAVAAIALSGCIGESKSKALGQCAVEFERLQAVNPKASDSFIRFCMMSKGYDRDEKTSCGLLYASYYPPCYVPSSIENKIRAMFEPKESP